MLISGTISFTTGASIMYMAAKVVTTMSLTTIISMAQTPAVVYVTVFVIPALVQRFLMGNGM